MEPFMKEKYGNASSAHAMGRIAREAVEKARAEVAALIGASPEEIFFTSGGTESDNWALFGAYRKAMERTGRFCLITTAFEHEAVLESARALKSFGVKVLCISPDEAGYVSAEKVGAAIDEAIIAGFSPSEILVSVMFANNELGTVQPIEKIGALCRDSGVLFHTDAVQAVGHISVNVRALSIDLLSASAHKFGGPKGTGFLFRRKGVEIAPLLYGGGQERSLRAGTYAVAGIVGMGAAAATMLRGMEERNQYIRSIRDSFRESVLWEIPGTTVNGPRAESDTQPLLPGHLNLSFAGVESSSLLLLLDSEGVCASGGSACAAMREEPSHVLLSIGCTEDLAGSALRFSFGEENTKEEAEKTMMILKKSVEKLRQLRGWS